MKKIIGSLVLYNTQWEDLKIAVDSFFFSAPEAELHIWDNSPDTTLGNKLQADFGHRIRYKHSPQNIGYGSGHNQNFKNSQGEYFCILNPDIVMSAATLPSLVRFTEANPKIGLVSCLIKSVDGSPQEVHKLMPSFKDYVVNTLRRFLKLQENQSQWQLVVTRKVAQYPMMSGCFMFFTRSHFEELQGFDEQFFLYFEDYDISLRSFLLEKSAVVQDIAIIHKWQRASHKHWKSFLTHSQSGLKFFNKWGFSSKTASRINMLTQSRNL